MEIVDRTGLPRRDNELIEAREAIKKQLITLRNMDPIMVYYPTIINALNELLERRRKECQQSNQILEK